MQVETYEVVETDAVTGEPECEADALALIDKLDLEGQRELIRPAGGSAERIPYRRMNSQEQFVYRQLLPERAMLKTYRTAPIPLRVLQVAAHAVELFDNVQVWSTKNPAKDPVLVGWNGSQHESNPEYFILARWGEVLEPFAELCAAAVRKFKATVTTEMHEAANGIAAKLKTLADMPDSVDAAIEFRVPHVYGI